MDRIQYLTFHRECIEKMHQLTKDKSADYCGDNPSPFANFEAVELDNITSTEIGFLTRMRDKWSRIISFIKLGKYAVKSESFEDTCLDMANYLILLAAYMKKKKYEQSVTVSFGPEEEG